MLKRLCVRYVETKKIWVREWGEGGGGGGARSPRAVGPPRGCAAAAGLQPPRQPRRAVARDRRGGGREGDSSVAAAGLRLCVGRQGGDAASQRWPGGSGGFDGSANTL